MELEASKAYATQHAGGELIAPEQAVVVPGVIFVLALIAWMWALALRAYKRGAHPKQAALAP